jgi:phenylpropionate dioxygenase-like ring-hydroxylating dioxygenase large terminal subunit
MMEQRVSLTRPEPAPAATPFLRNAWYVAALSRDLGRTPYAARLLGEEVVLFRQQDGTPVALEDACPHRRLPLSMGRIKGDAIECGYHGLTFDACGRCIDAATQDRVPPFAAVRSYPVRDRYGLLWIWMGDPAQAQNAPMLHIPTHDAPGWHLTEGDVLVCQCHYLWLVDNLLDPSHVAWVHRSSFAGAGTASTPLRITQDEHGVNVDRWLLDQPPPPFYAPLVKFAGHADRYQGYEMRFPSIGINRSIYVPAGQSGAHLLHDGSSPDDPMTYRMISYNLLTPVDADTTLYFWLQHRNTDAHDDALTQRIAAGAKAAFEEDRQVLEAVHRGMKRSQRPTAYLQLDRAATQYRKALAERIAREQAEQGGHTATMP